MSARSVELAQARARARMRMTGTHTPPRKVFFRLVQTRRPLIKLGARQIADYIRLLTQDGQSPKADKKVVARLRAAGYEIHIPRVDGPRKAGKR